MRNEYVNEINMYGSFYFFSPLFVHFSFYIFGCSFVHFHISTFHFNIFYSFLFFFLLLLLPFIVILIGVVVFVVVFSFLEIHFCFFFFCFARCTNFNSEWYFFYESFLDAEKRLSHLKSQIHCKKWNVELVISHIRIFDM